ncbi:MAG: hypothetical protein E6K82_20305, partial [Candidatus Rokuibacteriota bacterium]
MPPASVIGRSGSGSAAQAVAAASPPRRPRPVSRSSRRHRPWNSVGFATADGTAVAGTDYTATSGVLTFTPGVTARTFAVPIRNDGVVEPDRTIMLTLSAPAGGAGLGPQSTAQIVVLDDDAPGTLQFSGAGYRVAEGGLATITVTRTGGSGGTVGVNYTVTAGTATSGVDYLATSGVLTFGPGVTRQTFSVLTLDNLVVDGDRTITLTLDQPTGGATIGTPSVAVLTIGDNDRGGTVQFSTAVSTVTEGAPATIAVVRAGGTAGGVTVHYVTVSTFADRIAQGDRTVGLQLTTPGGGATLGTPSTAMLRIVDDEPKLRFSAGAYRIDEGGTATITVLRSGATTGTVTVAYAPNSLAAAAAVTSGPVSGTLTFGPGVLSRTFTLATLHDPRATGNQALSLVLSDPVGATLTAPSTTVLTIADDEFAGTVQFSAPGYSASDRSGVAMVSITRTGGTASDVTVQYTTSDGSATAGADYVPTSGTVSFGLGETSKTFAVPLIAPATPKPTESVRLTLSDPTGGASLGPQSSALIFVVGDLDQTPPSVSITTPLAGAIVSGQVKVGASAWDLFGVVGVQFQLDGVNLGAELTAAPYVVTWDTTGVLPGSSHTLQAVARDAAGNTGTSAGVIVKLPADITAPVVTAVRVSSITTSGAAISWTTNKASDSQVEYGPTTAYGSLSSMQSSLVMSHPVTLNGLAAARVYHFRARSRDISGNLGVSADATFTTPAGPDVTAPTVSITAPAAGATVSGRATVTASATDDVGVVGVQFQLDGAPLGAEVIAAPWTVTWDTTTASLGPHTLTATARDAAGNVGTAAGVTVTVADTTPPVISGVTAASITTSGAAISWTTNKASDSQVEYGPTTAYGSLSPMQSSLVTAHPVTLGGLGAARVYHFRARSR